MGELYAFVPGEVPVLAKMSLADAWIAFERSCKARRLSTKTIKGYQYWLDDFTTFVCEDMGLGAEELFVSTIKRSHVEEWLIIWQGVTSERTGKPISSETLSKGFTVLRTFFNWLVEFDVLYRSPMLKMKKPRVTHRPVEVLPKESLVKMLAVCQGDGLVGLRDMAMILMLWDTGCRRAELLSMQRQDLDLTDRSIMVHGKGDKYRKVFFGQLTLSAVGAYVDARDRSEAFDLPELWVSFRANRLRYETGMACGDGVGAMLARRALEAGIAHVHPHQLRHSFAHYFLKTGGQESDLGSLLGWSSPVPTMLKRYAASLAVARSQKAHRRFGPGDQLIGIDVTE